MVQSVSFDFKALFDNVHACPLWQTGSFFLLAKVMDTTRLHLMLPLEKGASTRPGKTSHLGVDVCGERVGVVEAEDGVHLDIEEEDV